MRFGVNVVCAVHKSLDTTIAVLFGVYVEYAVGSDGWNRLDERRH